MAERLACGCVIDTVGEAFVMEPCAFDCDNYRFALDESRRQGKPIQPVIDPDLDGEDVGALAALLREAGLHG